MRHCDFRFLSAAILGLVLLVPAVEGVADEFDDPLQDAVDRAKSATRAPASVPAPAAANSPVGPEACRALQRVLEVFIETGAHKVAIEVAQKNYELNCAPQKTAQEPAESQQVAAAEPELCGRLHQRLARMEAAGRSGRVAQLRGMIAQRCSPGAEAPQAVAAPPTQPTPEPVQPAPPPRELAAWEKWDQQEWEAASEDFTLTTSADWTATGNSGFRYCVNIENPTGARLTGGAIAFRAKDGAEMRLPLRFWDEGVGPLSSGEGCVVARRDAAEMASIITALDAGKATEVVLQPGVNGPELAKVERQKELGDWLSRAMQQ